MADVHRHYLFDLGYLIREQALTAKQSMQDVMGTEDAQFQAGRLLAYYEVVSLLISQARAFELPIEDLHLDGLLPDRDLLSDC